MQIMLRRVNVISRSSRNSLNFKIFNLDESIIIEVVVWILYRMYYLGSTLEVRVLIKIELRNLFIFLSKEKSFPNFELELVITRESI